ncbi:MAG: hypothetical protein MR270_02870, partial [Erysipelotrichaceae bacterium]|nr:hypothetical protein [Erysipelotrichaceae bacterium]
MKKVNISKKIIFTLLSLCLIVFITVSSYAVSAIISAKNKIEINTLSLDASSSYSYSSLDEKLSFKSSDDTKSVNTTITNNSLAILHYYFQISTTQALSDDGIEKAILVYYDNKLVASLFEIIENNIIIQGDYSFVRQGGATANNVISFKLHEATSESLYQNKTLPITITAYCENANYSSYLYVSNEEEFKKAIDDVNNELYSNHIEAISEDNIVDGTLINVPTIVLLNNISLTTSELTLTSP